MEGFRKGAVEYWSRVLEHAPGPSRDDRAIINARCHRPNPGLRLTRHPDRLCIEPTLQGPFALQYP